MPKVILMVISGSLGGLAVGYNSGVVVPALLYMGEVHPEMDVASKSVRIS